MKIKFDRITTSKTDNTEDVKLNFSGSFNGMDIKMTLSGDKDIIEGYKNTLNLERFGQQLDLDIENTQTTLEEVNKNEN